MKKKKIKKLEISKEDITILSRDEAQGILGGQLTDYKYGDGCIQTYFSYDTDCSGANETANCTSTIADTQLCNLSSAGNCSTDWYGGGCRT